MGPSLARGIKCASEAAGVPCRVMAVSRFSAPKVVEYLQRDGIETLA